MDVGQTVVAALEAERQAFVVEAQCVQQRRVQVVDVHGVFDDVVAELVGFAVRVAGFDAAAGKPPREAAAVMVAADERVVDLRLARTACGRTRCRT